MSEEQNLKNHFDLTEFYRQKELRRKIAAKRPIAEKMAIVERLREFERSLADVRQENKAIRAAKKIQLKFKLAELNRSRQAHSPPLSLNARACGSV